MNNSRNLLENPLEGIEDKSILRKSVSYPIEEDGKKAQKTMVYFFPPLSFPNIGFRKGSNLHRYSHYKHEILRNIFSPSLDSSLFCGFLFSYFSFFFPFPEMTL